MDTAAGRAVATLDRPGRALCPLAMQVRSHRDTLIGRIAEVAALEQELATASGGGLACVSLEGEPGIGKTRLLMAAQDLLLSSKGSTVSREEIRTHISGNYCRCTGYQAIVDAIDEVINGKG